METVNLKITGNRPLLMHNGRLSDPLNPYTCKLAELTSIRNKTVEDLIRIARAEWEGSLYWEDEVGLYLPGSAVARCLRDAATKFKLGKSVVAAVNVNDHFNPLRIDGPNDIDKLWEMRDKYMLRVPAKVGMARVIRTRPQFAKWSATVEVTVDTDEVDMNQFSNIIGRAGEYVGLLDWRPTYGRFYTKIEKA